LADVHKVVGLGSVGFNLLFGLTGAVLGLEGIYHRYLAPPPRPLPQRHAVGALPPGRLDNAVRRAVREIPGSRAAGADLILQRGLIRVRVEHPTAALVKEHQSNVLFDAANGEVLAVSDATGDGAAARLYYAMEPLHFGRLGGALWVKLLWGLMGASGGLLSISGFAIYVLRTRKSSAVRPAAAAIPAKAPAEMEWMAEVVR
jgi:uncharacterized iron-regulated membrane protein